MNETKSVIEDMETSMDANVLGLAQWDKSESVNERSGRHGIAISFP
jgi:hypothetical protein